MVFMVMRSCAKAFVSINKTQKLNIGNKGVILYSVDLYNSNCCG